jgi:hypothetical protein
MKISLVHATRGRSEKAIGTRKVFFDRAVYMDDIEYIFAVDEDDFESQQKLLMFNPFIVAEPNGCVKSWNGGAKEATGDLLIMVADDMVPPPNWDDQLLIALELAKVNPKKAQKCIWVSDGHRTDDLMCWTILTRARYENQGYVFHPDYFGVYCDNEYTHVAKRDGVIMDCRDIVFEHDHPSFGRGQWDETYLRQNNKKRYDEGLAIFNKHFPNHEQPK